MLLLPRWLNVVFILPRSLDENHLTSQKCDFGGIKIGT